MIHTHEMKKKKNWQTESFPIAIPSTTNFKVREFFFPNNPHISKELMAIFFNPAFLLLLVHR